MKKLISLLLCMVIVTTIFTACNDDKKSDDNNKSQSTAMYGTNGAKILLARQRLNGDKLTGFGNKTANAQPIVLGKVYSSLTGSVGTVRGNVINISKALTCTSFPDYCNYADYYSGYMNNMDAMIERNITLIDYIKNYISITDRWIEQGNESYLLQVEGSSETVYVKSEYGYTVFTRYTNELAQNVYEMYIDESGDHGTTKMSFLCIPDVRYEYTEMLNHGEQSDLTLVADKDKGYWNFFLISASDQHANVNNLIMLEDIYYEASHYVNVNSEYDNINPLKVMTSDFKYDIFWVRDNEVELCLTGFTGVSSVTGVSDEGNGSVTLSNGTVLKPGTKLCDDKVEMSFASVGELGDIGLYATVAFNVQGDTMSERLAVVKELLDETGIQCKVDYDTMAARTVSAEKVAANFKSTYMWNGEYVRTYEEVSAGFAVEKTMMETYASKYEAIKNAQVVSQEELDAIPREVFFTKISNPEFGTVVYENDTISVSGMTFTLSDSVFVEEGMEYTIGMDLIKIDDNDNMSYEESIPLVASGIQKTKCTDKLSKLTVTQTASYQMTTELYDGDYVLVAYVCTADGIRISEMLPVVMSEEANEKKEQDTYTMTISLNDSKNMIVNYASKKDIEVTYTMEKDSYTYDEIYNLMIDVAVNYGYPTDKPLETYDETGLVWNTLAKDSTISGGKIRITYTVDQETLEEAYVICLFE